MMYVVKSEDREKELIVLRRRIKAVNCFQEDSGTGTEGYRELAHVLMWKGWGNAGFMLHSEETEY